MRLLALIALPIALLAGCTTTNPGVPDRQDDIPVPLGFTRAGDDEDTKSYWEKQADYRLYRVTYDGEAKAGDISNFYAKEMPRNGWTVETSSPDATGGGAAFSFLKGKERCKVWVKQKGDEIVRVSVDIGRGK